MKLRLFLATAIVSMCVGCQCGLAGLCDQVKCGDGLECAPVTGKCVVKGTASDGGTGIVDSDGSTHDAGAVCPISCSGSTPVCDPVAQKCVVCTATEGCVAPTGVCDTRVVPSGACYGCRIFTDCIGESMDCDQATHSCYQFDAGFNSGHGPVQFDDAGLTVHCADVPPTTQMCKGESCPKGFACSNGTCVLNGRNGPVQVALRFNQPQDLDLYVVEPLAKGGTCEIYYSNPNSPPPPFPLPFPLPAPCGALMSLDRDSNRACTIDNVDVENIISPSGSTPTKGEYIVRVNYWQECMSSPKVPYEVEVRANGQTRYFCGSFAPRDANGGNQGAGVIVTKFTIL